MRRGTALVTGASGGFGQAISVALAERGFRVFAAMRDPARASELRAVLRGTEYEVTVVPLDVGVPGASRAVADGILTETGAVDVLVNNAGAMLSGFVEDVSEAELRAQFEVNFFGLVELTQACIPAMRERRRGRIINISSIGGRFATPAHGAYCASKFAVEGLSESLRYELYPYNVFVSLVEPGLFPTGVFGRNRWVAEAAVDRSSPHRKVMDRLTDATEALLHHRAGADPGDVGRVVARIALARKPRLRYPVGPDAWWTHAVGPWVPLWWQAAMARIQRSA